ncbi:hypothetical protein [Falsiroseomonas tokyonensis]|uniref:Uncharacterized protein n=1 Tax=Falsiroseomonas tokyonensis TaxID=430521 RepID=A0ABV7BTE4_9PROT|nr:hypothetical protein [Falsiroseomonas tokyonensis]
MIETMDPATQDKVVAIVSHLPHPSGFIEDRIQRGRRIRQGLIKRKQA